MLAQAHQLYSALSTRARLILASSTAPDGIGETLILAIAATEWGQPSPLRCYSREHLESIVKRPCEQNLKRSEA
jgi:hypothetical protein